MTDDDDDFGMHDTDPPLYCYHGEEFVHKCEKPCKCGHRCNQHDYWYDSECDVDGCDCEDFEDEDNDNGSST